MALTDLTVLTPLECLHVAVETVAAAFNNVNSVAVHYESEMHTERNRADRNATRIRELEMEVAGMPCLVYWRPLDESHQPPYNVTLLVRLKNGEIVQARAIGAAKFSHWVTAGPCCDFRRFSDCNPPLVVTHWCPLEEANLV